MSDTNGNIVKDETPPQHNPFSNQPTGLVETTLAETLGLSMHNAVTNQQSAQMTASASITNACARLLQSPIPEKVAPKKTKQEQSPEDTTDIETEINDNPNTSPEPSTEKKGAWQKLVNSMKRKPKDDHQEPNSIEGSE